MCEKEERQRNLSYNGDLVKEIKELLNGQSAEFLQNLDIDKRNKIIR
jgi:hypothetical protein